MAVQINFTTAETAGTAVAGNALDLALVQKDSATNTLVLGNGTAVTLAVAGGGTGSTTAAGALTNLGAAPLASPTFTGVPAASTAAAGTNTTQVATTAFVNTTVNDGWWESAEQTITLNTTITVAHGLARTPKDVQCFLRCKTAELGYAIDDEVNFSVNNASTGSSYNVNPNITRNGTNVITRITQNVTVITLSTGAIAPITLANWKVVFRAR